MFEGDAVVVTGGSSGIGKSLAKKIVGYVLSGGEKSAVGT